MRLSSSATAALAACALLVGLGSAILASAGLKAAPAALAPHRAAYALSLERGGEGVSDATGGLVLEWRADCGAWLSRQRLAFVARTPEGGSFDYDVRFSSWERPEAGHMRFTMRSYTGGEMLEQFRGTARLEGGPGSAGMVQYRLPETRRLELPSGTVFPTRHMQLLLEAAEGGGRLLDRPVFDGAGSHEQALTQVAAVIGRRHTADAAKETLPGGLAGTASWPVSLAYYAFDRRSGADELPLFEFSFALHENGILRDMVLDYGDFALHAQLEELELFKPRACE